MSSAIYFISDVHLGAAGSPVDDRKKLERLKELFGRISGPDDRLFILGDLFDFWFEYRTVVQKEHLVIIEMLRDLRNRKIAVDLLAGNHDFWIGDFLNRELGVVIHRKDFILETGGKRFMLSHGDGEGTGDLGYKIIKPVLRSPFTIWLYRLLHPDIGVPLAKWFSKISRNHLTKGMHLDPAPMIEAARKKFNAGYDYVLMGHTHYPMTHEENGRIYTNLGDFIENYSYAVFQNGRLSLEYLK